MRRGDQRPHLRLRIEPVADDDLVARLRESRQETIGELSFEDEPRAGAAHFALARVDAEHRKLERHVEVRVGEDDVRAFAAEFERDLFDVPGGRAA